MRSIEDAMERSLEVRERPARIVSLVPSLTELVFDLGAGERVVGVSRFCAPPGTTGHPGSRLARVGGPKDPDLEAIVALAPDLVLAVKEENHRRDVEALVERGLAVYVADVRSVEAAVGLVREIADLIAGEPQAADRVSSLVRAGVEAARSLAAGHAPLPLFCPIWRDPWMVAGPDTYMFDVLRLCGGAPVPRGGRGDRRYPKVTLDEVRGAAPRLTLLPDEPYRFAAADAEELSSLLHRGQPAGWPQLPELPQPQLPQLIDGKLLGWYGRRTGDIVNLAMRIDAAARSDGSRRSPPTRGSVLS